MKPFRVLSCGIALVAYLLVAIVAIVRPTSRSPQDIQPGLPVRAAFYYPWFPEAWNQQGIQPYTNYQPSLGYYNLSDQAIVRQHIDAMQYGGI